MASPDTTIHHFSRALYQVESAWIMRILSMKRRRSLLLTPLSTTRPGRKQMAAGGITSALPRNQKAHVGDPIVARARFVAGLLPRSGWLGLRPGTADTLGSLGPGAVASCTGRCALAKHGPTGPTPRGR